ncbi:hypothetical protein [Tissierella sp.]|uniref:hypothetical protein n=1 Tax=Tissierella sp. TaxID=41274 RepID=UPI00306F44E4
MSSGIFGLEEVLRDLDLTSEEIDEAMDDISKEVATEILDKAIANVNGPKNMAIGKVKKSGKKIEKVESKKSNRIKSIKRFMNRFRKKNDIPYPVSVNTGNLKKSLKIRKMGKGRRKVYADINIANYACHVHDGTSRMKARPFLDDAVDEVMDSDKYLDIAGKIIDDILNK